MAAPPDLVRTAQRLVWWDSAENAIENRLRLVAQVMSLGNWEDVLAIRKNWGEEIFSEVLRNPPPGIFDERSWHYWHHRCGIEPVPPMPRRKYANV